MLTVTHLNRFLLLCYVTIGNVLANDPGPLSAMKREFHVTAASKKRQDALAERTVRPVTRKRLINSLNKLHFIDGGIILNFRHRGDLSLISIPARPQPCLDSTLFCTWQDETGPAADLTSYDFVSFFISDGLHKIVVEADLLDSNPEGIRFVLPSVGHDVSDREVKRHPCRGVGARITAGHESVMGDLVNFSARSFSIQMSPEDKRSLTAEPGHNVDVFLSREGHGIFFGECKVVRRKKTQDGACIVLRPLRAVAPRHKPRKYRSLRPDISPMPDIVFPHPFTGNKMALKAADISGSGFAVKEHMSRAMLIPGMKIPDISIEFMSGFTTRCDAQVIYSEKTKSDTVKSGLAIVDMDVNDHTRLSSLLHQGTFKNSQVCTSTLNLDELWDFFFESGFIYPEKYQFIRKQKEHFRKLYLNLYENNPRIARHIIYRDKGLIFGHVSMLRYYRRTWLLQHHAAISSGRHKAGLVVMEHMLHFINEFHVVFPGLMKYIGCYFRPNNRFAERVFGGSVRSLDDSRKCSLDSFAYLHLGRDGDPGSLPERWELAKVRGEDLAALRAHYAEHSGGLLLQGLDLTERAISLEPEISREYSQLGFKRERHLYSLKRKGVVRAILAANVSDVGLNMSDLTNCLQAFVIDHEGLPPEVLFRALKGLVRHYSHDVVPVLVHPRSYADERSVRYAKTYDLGILDLDHFGPYLTYIKDLTGGPSKGKGT
jgi:hypothetical protein